jgi:hypothetical protein
MAVQSSRRAPAAAPQTFPLQGWPGNCVASLGATKRSVLSTHVCTAIKSLPSRYVKQLVRDADDREQLLQFAAQETDLNIHLQVSGRLPLLGMTQRHPLHCKADQP